MIPQKTVLEILNKFDIKDVENIFDALTFSTRKVFMEFLRAPEKKFTAIELQNTLEISESNTYRIIKKLFDLGLIETAGDVKHQKTIITRNGGTKLIRKGGPPSTLYKLSSKVKEES